MSQIGVGVLINMLCGGNNGAEILQKSTGKTLSNLSLKDALLFEFTDGSKIMISDDGQSCCESRYMTTDDDLAYYVGSEFRNAEIRDVESKDDDDSSHEILFLVVTTSKGSFTIETHNEHNGFYGGFSMNVSEI